MKRILCLLVAVVCWFTMHAQDSTLKEYVGKYIFPEGSVVPAADISIKDSMLVVNSVQGASDMIRKGKDTFTLVSFNGTAFFTRNAAHKIAGIRVEVEDILLEGVKEGSSALLQRKHPAGIRRQAVVK